MRTDKLLAAVTATLVVAGLQLLGPAPAHPQITGFDDAAIHVTLTSLRGKGSSLTAVCTGRLSPSSSRLEILCTRYAGSPGTFRVTLGPPEDGNVLFSLGGGAIVSTEQTLTEEEVAAFLTGQLWVVMTTSKHPQGEIAARLLPRTPVGEHVMRFPLRQDSLVYTGSPALAHCALRFNADRTMMRLLCTHDVANPGQLRVLIDGGTVATVSDVDSPFEASLQVLLDSYSRFLDGDFGLVLTSASYPQGEIGMVLDKCIEGPETLCLVEERFRVTVRVTPPGQQTRFAAAVPDRSADAGLFTFFRPDNYEILIKVLNACSINQSFWVFLSANTDVAYEVTVYDTLTGRTRKYSNPQGKVAVPVAATSAFSCS